MQVIERSAQSQQRLIASTSTKLFTRREYKQYKCQLDRKKKNKKKKPRNLFPKSSFSRISCQTSRRIRAVRPEVSWPSSFLASWLVCVSVSEMYHFTTINVNYGGIAGLIIRDRLSLPYRFHSDACRSVPS